MRCSCWNQTLEALFKCPRMGCSNFKSPASLQWGVVTECCSVVRERRTFPCNNPVSWAEQRLSSALVLQRFRDWAREQHKLCLISFPEGTDWSNIRSRLHWPVENSQYLDFFFPTACQSLWHQLYPNREPEEGEGGAMADGNPQGGENCILHFGTPWQGQLYSNLVCLQIEWGLFAISPLPPCSVRSLQDRQKNIQLINWLSSGKLYF